MFNMPSKQIKPNHIHSIYMYKEDLALNNLQWLRCQSKPKPFSVDALSWIHVNLRFEKKNYGIKNASGKHEFSKSL